MDKDRIQGIEKFEQGLEQLNIHLTDQQIHQFIKYYEILVEWNKVMNLTAITEFDEVIQKHFIDSLSLVQVYIPQQESIIDMGTGAGFPGIPLKIAFPELKIVLLDSLNKRVNFLGQVIKDLELKDIKPVHGRAEDFGRNNEYREKFDLCVSRAVAKLSTLSEYCMPYVKQGGYFIPYKSVGIEDELKQGERAVKILGGKIESVNRFNLPGSGIERVLVKIKKCSSTHSKYPRGSGKPSKEPL